MSPPSMTWSVGTGLRDTRPVLHEAADFDGMIEALALEPRTGDKERAPYFCAPMAGPRKAANALPAAWLAFDADHIDTEAVPLWMEWWRARQCSLWETHSSRPGAARYRALAALERAATPAERLVTGAAITGEMERALGSKVRLDACTLRPAQAILVPPPWAPLVVFHGAPLSVVEAGGDDHVASRVGGDGDDPLGEIARAPRARTSSVSSVSSVPFCRSPFPSVGELLPVGWRWPRSSVPTQQGERHACVFELARHLRALDIDLDRAALRQIAIEWFADHAHVIGTQDASVSVADLIAAYRDVRIPFGASMNTIVERAGAAALPPVLQSRGYLPNEAKLIRVCIEAAAHHDPEPFFLSCRVAGDILGMHYTDTARMLELLVDEGVLEVVRKGAGNRATRYRLGSWHRGRPRANVLSRYL